MSDDPQEVMATVLAGLEILVEPNARELKEILLGISHRTTRLPGADLEKSAALAETIIETSTRIRGLLSQHKLKRR